METDPTVLELHQQLLLRVPTASVVAAERFLLPVRDRLSSSRYRRDAHIHEEAAIDAILSYIERPEQFDPAKGTLLAYLVMSARGDLRTKISRILGRATHEISAEPVELARYAGNIQSKDHDAGKAEAMAELLERQAESAAHDDVEAAVLQLMLDGERSTSRFALVMGISGLDAREQQRQVKRVKDRLAKRLMRAGWGKNYDG